MLISPQYLYHRVIMTVCTTYYISSTIVQCHFLPPSAESEVGSSCLATIMSPSVAVTMAMSISPFSVSAHVYPYFLTVIHSLDL